MCGECEHRFSARTGTAYAGIRTPEAIFRNGSRQLAEGASLRATARIVERDKDTVCRWLLRLGRHCLRLLDYFFRDLHLTECQLDELWTFVYKKEDHLTAFEKLAGRYGDAWIWTAFDPVSVDHEIRLAIAGDRPCSIGVTPKTCSNKRENNSASRRRVSHTRRTREP